MTDTDDVEITAVNRAVAVAMTDTGQTIPVTNWLDCDGDEYAPKDAVVAVAGPDDQGHWYAIDLSHFDPVSLN